MEMIDLYDMRESYERDGIMICFAGPFYRSIIEELGNALRSYLEVERLTKTSLMDVFSVFVEQTQNVRNYIGRAAGDTESDYNNAIIIVGRTGDRHVVASGNVVRRRDITGAVEMIEHLRGLDKSGLKALFMERMRAPRAAGGSAGLGLIDMARKASQPLQYSVRDIGDDRCFFSLRVVV